MRFDILTIFPNFFGTPTEKSIDGQGIFGSGMLRRALMSGHVEAQVHDLRGFATDKHRTVDDRPFGGGEGMLLKPEPFAHALEKLSVGGSALGAGCAVYASRGFTAGKVRPHCAAVRAV
jgi:tRNA (guanine37-N1)-methyltransferase